MPRPDDQENRRTRAVRDGLRQADERAAGRGRYGGAVLQLFVRGSDGRLERTWLVAAPGARIAPRHDAADLTTWRAQRVPDGAAVAITLAQLVAALPQEREWACSVHRDVLIRFRARARDASNPALTRLEAELRAVDGSAPSGRRAAVRKRRPACTARVTAMRYRGRVSAPALHAAEAIDARVGQELEDLVVVMVTGVHNGRSAEVEVDLKRSVVSFRPRTGQVTVERRPLTTVHRIKTSPGGPLWDQKLQELVESVVDVL